jgi:hypothetical protein
MSSRETRKMYVAWSRLRRIGELPREWRDFDAFREAVGDLPAKRAYLMRYEPAKPYASGNVFWMYRGLLQEDPALRERLARLRRKALEERVAHEDLLLRIRNAKSREERNRRIVAARKAGYTLRVIGVAAGVTAPAVRVIVMTRCR